MRQEIGEKVEAVYVEAEQLRPSFNTAEELQKNFM